MMAQVARQGVGAEVVISRFEHLIPAVLTRGATVPVTLVSDPERKARLLDGSKQTT